MKHGKSFFTRRGFTSWQSCGGRRGVSASLAGVRPAMLRDLLLELEERFTRCSLLTYNDNSRQLLLIRDAGASFIGIYGHIHPLHRSALPFIDGIPIRTSSSLDMATKRATSGICEFVEHRELKSRTFQGNRSDEDSTLSRADQNWSKSCRNN